MQQGTVDDKFNWKNLKTYHPRLITSIIAQLQAAQVLGITSLVALELKL